MKPILRKNSIFLIFFILCTHVTTQLPAQNITQGFAGEPVILSMSDAGPFSITERSDWRRYDNGKYVGLVRNEVRASILPQIVSKKNADSTLYQGNFFVMQSTLRDMRHSAQAVDAIIPVSFEIMKSGNTVIEDDRGFPMMRGFPAFPNQHVTKGVKWRAPGNRAVDPFNTGSAVVIPFTAEYEYRGSEYYRDILVHRIYALYGYNYQNPIAPHPYARVMGGHKVDILVRAADGLPLFMRDDLNITYTLADNTKVEFKGFTLTFGSGLVPLNRGEVIASLGNTLNIKPPASSSGSGSSSGTGARTPQPKIPEINTNDLQNNSSIDLTPVPEGIKLTIKDIRFIADSPQFLPAEVPRLDLIANALKQIPDRTFLVEGHTASTGQPENEMKLSVERAQSLISELVKRGISAERFIYKGWGSTKPVGDNETDAGRSANRRVEITILE